NNRWSGYAFPGGHVENGEAFAESVIREIYEETGLTIQNPQLVGINLLREGIDVPEVRLVLF
ncbi:MutT/nudix family protein, partial [Streptococcus sp. GMD6S]